MIPLEEIRSDIDRYSSILGNYEFGRAKAGEIGKQQLPSDATDEIARHLENVIRELRALLRDR